MTCPSIFLWKDRKIYFKMSSAKMLSSMLSVTSLYRKPKAEEALCEMAIRK